MSRQLDSPLDPEWMDPPLQSLSPFERFAVRLVGRMNRGRWQGFWFWFQRQVAPRWISWLYRHRLEVHGLEHVAATSRERPLLIAVNHRTLFDLFIVMAVLFRGLPGWREILFPVRGRFFYQSIAGLLVNFVAAWWAMYPPFFHTVRKRRFDQYALHLLVVKCREGPGRLIGYHPEGTRNRSPDPYRLLPGQPGIGRLMLEARPLVVPVFMAGLSNSATTELRGAAWRRGEPVRIWFGPALDYSALLDQPPIAETYRRAAEAVMGAIRQLAEADRARCREGERSPSAPARSADGLPGAY